jgi:Zn-dependent protease
MRQHTFGTSGIRIGSIKGIDLWVHWSLLLLFFYQFHGIWVERAGSGERLLALQWWALSTGGLFLIILLHELGHCYAAYRMGGGADAIVLWPLGGLAYCAAPNLPRSQFWVAAGGPLVNVAIAALIVAAELVLAALRGSFFVFAPGKGSFVLLSYALNDLFWLNVSLLIFNLLPIWPLDGGQIFRALLWRRVGSFGRASLVTVWASRCGLVALFILSFFPPLEDYMGFFAIAIIIWAYWHTEILRRQIQEQEEDSVFGYDFSRGYTSLERTVAAGTRRARRPGFIERVRRRWEERRRQRELELDRQVDEILDKISTSGMASLTARERRILEERSRRRKEG